LAVDFRKTGSIRRRRELVDALDRDPDSVDFTRERPEEIAFLLKRFLCELPEPLLTFKLQELFIAAACEFEKCFLGYVSVTCIWL
jgi:hypothetical protein